MSKSPITCHGTPPRFNKTVPLNGTSIVLDSSTGKPAEGVEIRLQAFKPATFEGGPDIFQPIAQG